MIVSDNKYKQFNAKKFGLRLQIARKKAGLSQLDFQNKGVCTQNDISRYESGKLMPKDETIDKLANFIGCDRSYLKHGDGTDDDFVLEMLPDGSFRYEANFKEPLFGKANKVDTQLEVSKKIGNLNERSLGLLNKILSTLLLDQSEKAFNEYEKEKLAEYKGILSCKTDEEILNYAEEVLDITYDNDTPKNRKYVREKLFGFPTFKHLLVATKLRVMEETDEDLVEQFKVNPTITYFENVIEKEYQKRHKMKTELFSTK